jgi:hypothetical protein
MRNFVARWGALAALAVGILLLPAARLWLQGRADYRAGSAALIAGDRRSAQVYFEQAAKAYFPGNRAGREALARLCEIATHWEGLGEIARALSAAESCRGIPLVTPGLADARFARESQERVLRLRRALDLAYPEPGGPRTRSLEEYREALVRTKAPGAPGVILAFLFVCLAGGLLWRLTGFWSAPGEAAHGWRHCGGAALAIGAALVALALWC